MSDHERQNPELPEARWARILDRIELRQVGLGLKFWGPPLWLEVTMTGPDSDRWPANTEGNDDADSWNWQSAETCVEAETLFRQGADDEQLVVAVARYTVENLILNAVHEIGEWLRFDGRRVFPAHPSAAALPTVDDKQGNGAVQLTVAFGPPAAASALPEPPPVDQLSAQRQVRRMTEVASPSRFTYLPGTAVQYLAAGPIVRLHPIGRRATGWRSTWSVTTLDALEGGADAETLIGLVQRDVHGALVAWEADRVCRAFYLDHRRPWGLSVLGPSLGAEPEAEGGQFEEVVTLRIAYLDPTPIDA